MPRSLTEKEITYLELLTDRNLKHINKNINYNVKKGLNSPMDTKERIIRMRIRLKALQMAKDLTTIYMAGVLPGGSIKCKEPCCIIDKITDYRFSIFKGIDKHKSKNNL